MSRHLLPPNSTPLERALADACRMDSLSPEIIVTLWNPSTSPTRILPWLAWSLSVDDWDNTWDETTQRRVIAASIEIHRKKGTVGAVKRALTSLGHAGRLVEWWQTEPKGIPHTFLAEVEIGNRGIDDTAVAAIERQIVAVKPVRSHFTMRLVGRSSCRVHTATTALSGEIATIQPFQITEAEAPMPTYTIATGTHAFGSTTVYPIH